MVFKNEAQLKSFLLAKCKDALEASCEEVYQILDRFLKEFYSDYDPAMYERTYQLYKSLVVSEVVQVGNGFKANVYFDYSKLNYVTGQMPSGLQVMDAAAYGGHGAEGLRVVAGNTGVGIWNDPMELMNINEILKNRLIAEGIPIK